MLGSLTGACSSAGSGGSSNTTAPASGKPLRLGQPSPEEQEISRYSKTGKFIITPVKVVEGEQEDLRELGDDDKYAGKKVVWVYVNAKLVDGDAVKGPMVMTDVGAQAGAGVQASPLILIGDLSSRPKDCVSEDLEATWKQGDSRTACAAYLMPSGSKVTHVTYSAGFYKEPLQWSVPQ
ncbi:hypothetical protein [Streptomyces sp. 7N604]|uniref:hypothetical protein n=1 Tax=Streptomyces sp. 7N604 TaxID=3457415 RepID=UPI003FD5E8C0